MVPVVFVAPFFAETTVRFIDCAAGLDGVRLALVSQDPLVEVLESNTTFGDLAAGESVEAATPLRVRVSDAAPAPYRPGRR